MSTGNMGDEHPFLNVKDIKEQLSPEEIVSKLKDILEKLNFAYRTGNQPLITQLNQARATYARAQEEKLTEMFSSDKNIEGKIDIS